MHDVSFSLNGRPVTAAYEEGMTLLEILRDVCGVTSPKDGCAPQGTCGCCKIMVDGRPARNIYAAGEIMAGNVLGQGYLAGIGMTIGTVFGWKAGEGAARHAGH